MPTKTLFTRPLGPFHSKSNWLHYLLIGTPLLIVMVVTAHLIGCSNGQNTPTPTSEKILGVIQAKLTKTQNGDEYSNIHCALKDKKGRLWFGTIKEGLYQYDGKFFTQYTQSDGLASNTIWSILEDREGNIWLGTDDGVSIFNEKTFTTLRLPKKNHPVSISLKDSMEALPKNEVWSMMQDKTGVIWLGTSQDLYCYDGKNVRRFLDNPNIINKSRLKLTWIQCITQDKNGIIWLGSGPVAMEGLCRFDGQTISHSKPNGDGWIRHILEDRQGRLWFSGRYFGVFTFNGKTFQKFTHLPDMGHPIFVDNAANIWFTGGEKANGKETNTGVWKFDGTTYTQYGIKDGLSKYSVWSMVEDQKGHIWMGTRNNGLYRFDGFSFSRFSE